MSKKNTSNLYSWKNKEGREVAANQGQITLRKEVALFDLLKDLDLEETSQLMDLPIGSIVSKFAGSSIICDLFGIVLDLAEGTEPEDIWDMHYDVQKKVVTDFFSLNGSLGNDLKDLFTGKIFGYLQTASNLLRETSSTSSAKETSPGKTKQDKSSQSKRRSGSQPDTKSTKPK